MTQTAYYSDYGVRVRTERPPPSDTADFKDLMRKQAGTADHALRSRSIRIDHLCAPGNGSRPPVAAVAEGVAELVGMFKEREQG